jgi:hypothetical protein
MGILMLASLALIALGATMTFRSAYVISLHGVQNRGRAKLAASFALIALGIAGVALLMSQYVYFHS